MTWTEVVTAYGRGVHRLGEADPAEVAALHDAELLTDDQDVDGAIARHGPTAAVDSAAIGELQTLVERLDLAERVARRTLERSADSLAERRGEPRGSAVALHPTALRNAADRLERSRSDVSDARAAADAHRTQLDDARAELLLHPEPEPEPEPEATPEPAPETATYDEPASSDADRPSGAAWMQPVDVTLEPPVEASPEPAPEVDEPADDAADSWAPVEPGDDDLFERWRSGTLDHNPTFEDGPGSDATEAFDVGNLYASDDDDREVEPESPADGENLPPWVSSIQEAQEREPEPEPEPAAAPEAEPADDADDAVPAADATAATTDFDELFMDEAPTADLRQTRTLVLGVLVLSLGLGLALIGLDLVDTWVGLAPIFIAAAWGSVRLRRSAPRADDTEEESTHNPLLADVMAATDKAFEQRRAALGMEDAEPDVPGDDDPFGLAGYSTPPAAEPEPERDTGNYNPPLSSGYSGIPSAGTYDPPAADPYADLPFGQQQDPAPSTYGDLPYGDTQAVPAADPYGDLPYGDTQAAPPSDPYADLPYGRDEGAATGEPEDTTYGSFGREPHEPPRRSYEPPSFEPRQEDEPEVRRWEPIYETTPEPEPEPEPAPAPEAFGEPEPEPAPAYEAFTPVTAAPEPQRPDPRAVAAAAARRTVEDLERTGEVLAERLAMAEEEERVAERAWHELAGADADPAEVDEIVRRIDPQHEDALVKASDTATVRAASVLRERTLARWEETWQRFGLPVPPVEDAGRAVAELAPAEQVRLVCTDAAIDRATELSEALPAATVLVVERLPEPEPEPEPEPLYEPLAYEPPSFEAPSYEPPSFEAPDEASAEGEQGEAASESRRYAGFSTYLRPEADPDDELGEPGGFDDDDQPPSFS